MTPGKMNYMASTAAPLVAAAGTGNFFTIQGSASKTLRVQRIIVSGPTLTAVAFLVVVASKLSAAPTGGTSTTLTGVAADSDSAAASALIKFYTVAPTPGTSIGDIKSDRLLGLATVASAASNDNPRTVFDFSPLGGVVLRGLAEGLALSFAAAPATAVTMSVSVEWFEE